MEEKDSVVLVDTHGSELLDSQGRISTAGKMEAHQRGLLHSAVSVFVFNGHFELLLQKRATDKYHSPGKWTNTCCTHPHPGEPPLTTAHRRLFEEMGLKCDLKEVFTFLYKADVGNGLIEYEFDRVFIGYSDEEPEPDPSEASDWKRVKLEDLSEDLKVRPRVYSPWLRQCYDRLNAHMSQIKNNK